ncbi:hypothetical protein ThidrDRAFT_2337 [Thiorhodococcus drewsii AZ1]|uniref:Serine protease n=1 Tax=Thiorhodococcus drewsii AZ1 TaxID=765913 RepID=G2E224_9GAMM|nr:hypothetical protein [Thiorhodococcus drewsii]EGV30973.1 hypothetical protein ThidrDRAFT_2337 [Thiorhodococcus drewsii AZ1]
MHKDLIVAIFVPTVSDSGSSSSRHHGSLGTGYPVAADLVLTSAHVLNPPRRNRRAKIRVCWYYARPGSGSCASDRCWQSIDNDAVVWEGEGDLDAALICCPIPDAVGRHPCGRLTETLPQPDAYWQSVGFARADKRNGVREPGNFDGTLRSMAENAAFFEVIERAPPECEQDWRGASGMPVFVDGAILGVVKQVPSNYRGQKLEAVPSFRLLENARFRELLGLDEARERRERAGRYLLKLLTRSEALTRELALALHCAHEIDALVKRILDETPPLDDLFSLVLDVQGRLRDADDRTGARLAGDLTLAILPVLQEASVVAQVRRDRAAQQVPILALPTKLKTLAEIIMAAADQRPAECLPAATEAQWPEGSCHLPEPPEGGRDADGQRFREDWRAALIEAFARDDGRFAGLFRRYLQERFIQRDLRSAEWADAEQELLDTVAFELQSRSEDKDRPVTFYYIVPFTRGDSADVRRQREADIAALKRDFPHLVFLRLAGEMPLPAETARYGRLRSILYEPPESAP